MIKELVTWLVISLQLSPESSIVRNVNCNKTDNDRPVLAKVEHPGVDSDPVEVPGELPADVCLAAGRKPHHHNHMGCGGAAALNPRGALGQTRGLEDFFIFMRG